MNTEQILNCIRRDFKLSQMCSGVFPIDRLPPPKGSPESLIVNLDPHN